MNELYCMRGTNRKTGLVETIFVVAASPTHEVLQASTIADNVTQERVMPLGKDWNKNEI